MSYLKCCSGNKGYVVALTVLILVVFQAQASEKAEGYADNNGVRIWYKVEGNLNSKIAPIILIHGGPGATARPFEKTLGPELAKSRPVIYTDYRGTGRSDRPENPDDYSFRILASDIEVIRKYLGVKKWSVFGHSNGAATALTYAKNYPDAVLSLVLCAPYIAGKDLEQGLITKVALTPIDLYDQARALYKSNISMHEKFKTYFSLVDRDTRHRFQYFDPKNSDVVDKIQSDLSKELGRWIMSDVLLKGLIKNGFFEFDAYKFKNEITMPTLVLLGRFDSEISLEGAMKYALTISNGYVVMLNKSGHHPYMEQTKQSARSINSFLKKHIKTQK